MTIHDRFAAAFRSRVGQTLTTGEIVTILQSEADTRTGSILPGNHAERGRCWCAGTEFHIFVRVAPATYEVRDYARIDCVPAARAAIEEPVDFAQFQFTHARVPQQPGLVRSQCLDCMDKFLAPAESVADWERAHRKECRK